MGMVRATQKGEKPMSKAVAKAAKSMDKSDVKDSGFGLDFIDSIRPVEFTWDFRPENMAENKQGKNV